MVLIIHLRQNSSLGVVYLGAEASAKSWGANGHVVQEAASWE